MLEKQSKDPVKILIVISTAESVSEGHIRISLTFGTCVLLRNTSRSLDEPGNILAPKM